MSGEEGNGLRVVGSVVGAPVNVVRGTLDAGSVTSVAAGVVGGVGGAVAGAGVNAVKGVGRIFSSLFGY
ncbi:unnamed protein product [Adineta ricciae]|uniref:Uncharacterized protein n=1 Tax=Adineta ricciae TaxID=249248 RepID=A0A813RX06_ADIRI|nr:unnamed protein product [Adineta ricciae]CAF1473414.1 unnamed protein product [Adineta ricciae]